MRICVIASPALGKPLLVLPDGILLRWPADQQMPHVGDEFSGTAIRLNDPRHLEHLVALVSGNLLERCDAAYRLPLAIAGQVYSLPYANALRRIARRITKGLRSHVEILIQEGHRIGYRQVLYAVRDRSEPEQLRRWNATLESE